MQSCLDQVQVVPLDVPAHSPTSEEQVKEEVATLERVVVEEVEEQVLSKRAAKA